MCCVCEINSDTWKPLHSTPPPLSSSQSLGLLWIGCLGLGEMRGGTIVRKCSQLPWDTAAYRTLKCFIYLYFSHHAQGSPSMYKGRLSAKWSPQLNQDVTHGCLPRKCCRLDSAVARSSSRTNVKGCVKLFKMQIYFALPHRFLVSPQCL